MSNVKFTCSFSPIRPTSRCLYACYWKDSFCRRLVSIHLRQSLQFALMRFGVLYCMHLICCGCRCFFGCLVLRGPIVAMPLRVLGHPNFSVITTSCFGSDIMWWCAGWALGPTQSPMEWVPAVITGGDAAGAWRRQPTPFSAEVKGRIELCTSTPLLGLRGLF
jgi:hypothetical protein